MKYLAIILTTILLIFSFESKGQSAEITYTYYSDTSEVGMDREIEFPIIFTENSTIDSILNKNIRRDILFDTLTSPIDSVLSNMVSGASSFYLVSKMTFNKKNIISILVTCEHCGGNCSDYQEAFVYSLDSGNRLFISDVINSSLFYREVVKNDVNEQYRKSIKRILNLKDSCDNCNESDLDNFDFFIAKITQQRNEFAISSFCLYEDSIKIIDECPFNRIDSNMCPEVEFIYKYTNLAKYLKIEL
ncbi:hypothetical protein OAK35_00560 [Crocinitomicaceae bacterium]|nr:hypothetical protein [Crocinitomicaceae bacterium]